MATRRIWTWVLGIAAGVALLFTTARPAEAWRGGWGYGGWGWGHHGWYGGWGWGYPGYGYGYYGGYYPYRAWYGWPYGYSYYYPSYSSYPTYSYSAPAYAFDSTSSAPAQSFYYAPSVTDNRAHITINLPEPNARLWMEGQLMGQGGTVRNFESPLLEPGHTYHYTIRAQWRQDGSVIDRTQTIRIQPNQEEVVNFR